MTSTTTVSPITAATTPEELQAALLPLLKPDQWDVRCNRWGLVFYPAAQTRNVAQKCALQAQQEAG